MNRTISLLRKDFQSSSSVTPEFRTFSSTFKREFNRELESIGATNPEYSVGHFYISGFYTLKGQVYYFSLSDVRYFKERKLLIREAKGYKDYTGGRNCYVPIEAGMGKHLLSIK